MWLKKLTESLDFSEAWSRFSLSIVSAILISLLFILKIEDLIPTGVLSDSVAIRLFYALSVLYTLGVFFSFNKIKASWPKYQGPVVAISLSVLYFLILPVYPSEYTFARHLVVLGIITLAVPLTKFWDKEEESVFWAQVVHSIYLFVETSFFSLFLYATLSLALVAIEKLFNIDFSNIEIYADLFILIAIVFHPLYFLSKYKTREELRYDFKPNAFIKTFSSKILLGTVLLYAVILLVYFAKIIITRDWPSGWVSNLILSFSIMGILCYGINKYLFGKPAEGVIALFKKWFFPFLFICCIFLSIAIYLRVSEYGITEPRYMVICSAIWIFLIALYFIISKRKDLRYLFVSLIAFLFLMFFAPFNLFETSAKSQAKRLSELLDEYGYNTSEAPKDLTKEQRFELTQLFRFFEDRNRIHDVLSLSERFSDISFNEYTHHETSEFVFFFRKKGEFDKGEPIGSLCKALDIDPQYSKAVAIEDQTHYNFRSTNNNGIAIDSFDILLHLSYPVNGSGEDPLITFDAAGKYVIINQDSVSVSSFIPDNYQYGGVNDPPIVFDYRQGDNDYRMILRECHWFEKKDSKTLTYLRGVCLVREGLTEE